MRWDRARRALRGFSSTGAANKPAHVDENTTDGRRTGRKAKAAGQQPSAHGHENKWEDREEGAWL